MKTTLQYDNEWSQRILNIYQTPDVVMQPKRVLEQLKLKRGDTVLDIGSGPRLMAQDIAQIVGNEGNVKCVNISDAMNMLARQVCSQYPYVEIKKSGTTAIPFPDHSFDAAVSTQVYEYVDDVELALSELHRVLKPGGRALILDTDWDTLIWNTQDIERMQRILRIFKGHCSHPRLPRTLTSQLQLAGFLVKAPSIYVILNTSYDPNTYSHGLIDFIAAYAANSEKISPEEVQV